MERRKKEWQDIDQELFQKLREKRTELAQKRAVPAYIIFGDKTLRDIAAKKPVTKEAFSNIYGVGESKLKSYADIFIEVVNDFGLNHSHSSEKTKQMNNGDFL